MNNIKNIIEQRKAAINDKKYLLKQNLKRSQRELVTPMTISLSTLCGLLIGFAILPKKFRLMKLLFKTFTVLTTVRQVMDLIHRPPIRERPPQTGHKLSQ